LFIDEIHRLSVVVEEALYPAIEEFRIDVMTGQGAFAESVPLHIKPFTLVAATTRSGLLTKPLHERFGLTIRLDFYPVEDLERIVARSARLFGVACTADGARTLAERSRGTPRVANRLLRRTRDFAEVQGSGRIDRAIVEHTCERLDIVTTAARSGSRRSPRRSPRLVTRSRTFTSRSCCNRGFWRARLAGGWQRAKPMNTSGCRYGAAGPRRRARCFEPPSIRL
jgi:Holliday junction DNA helicase RuvB